MKLFTYTLSNIFYISGKPGISLIEVNIFAESNNEADEILHRKFPSTNFNIDNVEEN